MSNPDRDAQLVAALQFAQRTGEGLIDATANILEAKMHLVKDLAEKFTKVRGDTQFLEVGLLGLHEALRSTNLTAENLDRNIHRCAKRQMIRHQGTIEALGGELE